MPAAQISKSSSSTRITLSPVRNAALPVRKSSCRASAWAGHRTRRLRAVQTAAPGAAAVRRPPAQVAINKKSGRHGMAPQQLLSEATLVLTGWFQRGTILKINNNFLIY